MIIKVDRTEFWKTSWNLQTGGANFCGQGILIDEITELKKQNQDAVE